MAPTTLLAGVAFLWADSGIRRIMRGIGVFELLNHRDKVIEAIVLRFGSFFVTWFLGCFALASIASVVNRLGDSDDTSWIPDRHQRAREHLGSVFVAALITFSAFLAGNALSELVQNAAVRVVGWPRFSRFSYAAGLVGYVTVATLISWLGASIPLLIRGDTKVWAALKRSLELSSGYEGALFLLVVESVAGTLVAGYATFHILHAFVPSQFGYTPWYGWGVNLTAILASAAMEAPLFIGLSLLADPEFHNALSLPGAQQAT
jgi:hypothetical protein